MGTFYSRWLLIFLRNLWKDFPFLFFEVFRLEVTDYHLATKTNDIEKQFYILSTDWLSDWETDRVIDRSYSVTDWTDKLTE